MVKKIFAIIACLSLIFISCGTTDKAIEETEPQAPEEVIEIEETIEPVIEEPEIPEVEEVEEVIEIDEVEEVEDVSEIDEVEDVEPEDEFTRSTNELDEAITIEEFNEDKAAILEKIQQLDSIMENYEFDNWKKHIAPSSIEYYSNPLNLRKAQKKLPDKSIQIKGLRDYFRFVFVPSRKMSKVDEIRYISKTYTKAVEVREEDNTTVVYYYFVKENGEWLVHLPEIN